MQRALLSAGAGEFQAAGDFAADSERLRPDVNAALFRVLWLLRAGNLVEAGTVKMQLETDYVEEVANSVALQSQLQNIEQQLAQ